MTTKISEANIQDSTLATLLTSGGGGPKISAVIITDDEYTDLNDTAVALEGGYIKLLGSGFAAGVTVSIDRTPATSVTFISETELHVQVAARTAGTYIVYAINTDGGVALRVNGLTYSGLPTWVTSSSLSGDSGSAVSLQLDATDATTFELQAGSTLPTGLTLSSGGLLSGTVTVGADTVYNFTVVAIDAELQDSPRSFSITISTGDPLFPATTLLLSGSADTFVSDASENNFPITVFGDTKPNRFNPYAAYWSNYFDAKTDYVSVPATASLTTFTGDFTFEAWIFPSDTTITYWKIWDSRQSGATAQAMVLGLSPLSPAVTGQGRLDYYNGSSSFGTGIVYYNRWTHIAFVRSGSTMTFYIDGVAGGTATVSGTQTGSATSNPIYIGTKDNGLASYGTTGYMSNFRIVNGTAVYTSDFTPSSTPLTAIPNTVLLTFQNSRYIDNSENAFSLTPSSTTISEFSPFVEPSSVNGSAYFDGSGDYVATANDLAAFGFGTNDFTVELWSYNLSTTSYIIFDTRRQNETRLNIGYNNNGTGIQVSIGSTAVISSSANLIPLGTWAHIAVARSGDTLTLYINGVSAGSATATTDLGTSGSWCAATAGDARGNASYDFGAGYISNVRVVKGTAVYTSNFTPPAAPLTAISGTSLLTLQKSTPVNNNVFLDASANNLLSNKVGNTSQGTFSPYSPSGWSAYFDGTGDYLTLPLNSAFAIGLADFTVEAWVYPTAANLPWTVIIGGVNYGSSSDWNLHLGNGTTALFPRFQFTNTGANNISSSVAVAQHQWSHIAVTRSSGTARMFINGVETATADASTWSLGNVLQKGIGGGYNGNSNTLLTGYISNLRVISGTALYTTGFTTPTAPLTAINGTVLLTCQRNRFIDNSPTNFVITRVGDASIQNFSPFKAVVERPISYSTYFDGTGDYLTVPTSNFLPATNTYTIEMWVHPTAWPSGTVMLYQVSNANASNFGALIVSLSGSGTIKFEVRPGTGGTNVALTASSTIALSEWSHIAVSVDSGSATIYLNGVARGTATVAVMNDTQTFSSIGYLTNGYTSGQSSLTGYISNVRVIKGTALYTANFTPPTEPLTAVENTSLLTCQNSTFIDNSTNSFAITGVGNSRPVEVNPFGLTSASNEVFDAAKYSGSMYFDGTGDYVDVLQNNVFILGTNDFTMECWVYPLTSGVATGFISHWNIGGQFIFSKTSANRPSFGSTPVSLNGTSTLIETRAWNHVVAVKKDNVYKLYVNGIADDATTTNATAFGRTDRSVRIGVGGDAGTPITGFISDARITKGRAMYTNNFVPPTEPMISEPSTIMLISGSNSGIIDATNKNVLETVGNATISTAVSKFGGSSIYFDGSGDWLVVPDNPNINFGSGDFTLEFWVYFNVVNAEMALISKGWTSSVSYASYLIYMNSAGSVRFLSSSNGSSWDIANEKVITQAIAQTWTHIAVTRSGSTFRVFVNGVINDSFTFTSVASLLNSSAQKLAIGGHDSGSSTMNGYLQDVRITKGIARYTSNFTPPTSSHRVK